MDGASVLMKMIFVDVENIGVKELEKIEVSVIDKVFVFSKSDAVKRVCEKSLFLYISDYPSGSNQADFCIIAYLSRALLAVDKELLNSVKFELYSNDENLISAFIFQCHQLGAASECIRTRQNTVVPMTKPTSNKITSSPVNKLLKVLSSPHTLDPNLQKKIGLSQSDFTKLINELVKENLIKRAPNSKKKWVKCE